MRCRNLFLFPCSLSFSLSLFTFHSARQPSTNLHSRYDPQLLSAEFISSAGSVHLLHIPIVQVSLPLLELGGREKVFFFWGGVACSTDITRQSHPISPQPPNFPIDFTFTHNHSALSLNFVAQHRYSLRFPLH